MTPEAAAAAAEGGAAAEEEQLAAMAIGEDGRLYTIMQICNAQIRVENRTQRKFAGQLWLQIPVFQL